MNRDLMEFVFKDTTVRVTDIDGNPMPFILDIARALQYKRSDRQCNNWISRLSKIRLFDIRNKKRYLTHGGSSLPLSELNNIVVDEQSTYYLIQKATLGGHSTVE